MDKKAIAGRLGELGFDKNEYWLITGSAMVFYGLRPETGDIDLGCSSSLADELEKHYPVQRGDNGRRCFKIGSDIEVFEDWLEDKVVIYEGFPLVSLQGLLKMKKKLGREKDKRDIGLLEEYLKNER